MYQYYLVSSLPTLMPGERPGITREEFLRRAAEQLNAADLALLRNRLADGLPEGADPFSHDWRAVEISLRNACVRQRAARMGVDALDHVREGGDDPTLSLAVAAAFNAPDPLARERALDAIRWTALERLAGYDPFTFRALQCYAARLHLAWRLAELDGRRGHAIAARLAGIKTSEPAGVSTP